jgi:hypothetical protein
MAQENTTEAIIAQNLMFFVELKKVDYSTTILPAS